MKTDYSALHVRWMIRRDQDRVLEIEKDCFASPWTRGDFERAISTRNKIGMVVEELDEHQVLGFMIYELFGNRLNLARIAVEKRYRREGVGSAMIRKLLSKLGYFRRTMITAKLRESELEAQLFFKSFDFRAIGLLRGYFDGNGEDAYMMRYRLPSRCTRKREPAFICLDRDDWKAWEK